MSRDADPLADEFALIAEIFAPLAKADANSFGLTDDAAIISPPAGKDLVVTADMMVAGVHFFADDAPDMIARKLMRVNLSDLAAKGAAPHGYILTVALPRNVTMAWLRSFAKGLAHDQAEFGINLLGGDTTATNGPLCLSLTAMGWVNKGRMLRRAGAQISDDIYVTGTIGDAVLGLRVRRDGPIAELSADHNQFLLERYLLPQPRNIFTPLLSDLAHAGIDISDGLAADLGHVIQTSSAGAEIQLSEIPLSNAAKALLQLQKADIADLISGGDDYELLLTSAPAHRLAIAEMAEKTGVSITRIGQIISGSEAFYLDENGARVLLKRAGYRHF